MANPFFWLFRRLTLQTLTWQLNIPHPGSRKICWPPPPWHCNYGKNIAPAGCCIEQTSYHKHIQTIQRWNFRTPTTNSCRTVPSLLLSNCDTPNPGILLAMKPSHRRMPFSCVLSARTHWFGVQNLCLDLHGPFKRPPCKRSPLLVLHGISWYLWHLLLHQHGHHRHNLVRVIFRASNDGIVGHQIRQFTFRLATTQVTVD